MAFSFVGGLPLLNSTVFRSVQVTSLMATSGREENVGSYIPNEQYDYWKMKINSGFHLTTKYIVGKFECHGCLAKLALNATLQENKLVFSSF